jgi:peptide/nickel transport system ATP-binding protein
MPPIILEVNNLSISFSTENGMIDAVKNINFSIHASEILAIVGESGSGKSVCSLAIMGLLPKPASIIKNGDIVFCNQQNLLKLYEKQMALLRGNEIAMIFQEPMTSLNPLMTCGKQVAEAFILHKNISKAEAKIKTIALFTEVKIPNPAEAYHKYPHEMSGGQKQRVMIAMALSCEPKLLIADEPTTALDVSVQKEILELLQELQLRRGTAIIFITHDLAIVKNLATKVLVMLKGECVEYGNVAQIFSAPNHGYTQALLHCRPTILQRIKILPTVADYLQSNQPLFFKKQIESFENFAQRQLQLASRETILEVQNASIKYVNKKNIFGKPISYFTAVENINLIIKKGETIGIVGESGCGKTTLGKAFVKLNTLSTGSILYKGKNIFTDWDNSYHQQVQIIFQDPYSSLNPRKTIGFAIEEPMHVHHILPKKDCKNRVHFLLQKVGLLPEHYDRYPHEFSGGQRQRICIARALAMKAHVIICDESVSALDVSVQAQVLNLLNNLRDEFELTILFISHDMNVIRHLSDRIIVMQKGKIIEEANAYTLFETPENQYTKDLIAAVPG